ncbi:GAF and ANTAR domain-containing protein [Actinosynnema sp. NPDC020468]|uniref:GAF and ANTAR domain-containing protein n=1 Tax=Actinosynnema sp. NPDC020468 TaxID=3154488 RepID=UPI0033FA6430
MTISKDDTVLELALELAEATRLADTDDVQAVARRFAQRLADCVPGCAGVVINVRAAERSEVVVGSDGLPTADGTSLGLADAGPVGEVLRYGEPRRIDDTAEDTRWPGFSARLVERGLRSCLVLPVPTKRSPAAALTLLSERAHHFDAHTFDLVLLLALHAGVAFDNAELFHGSRELVANLTTALETRHSIGLAQGILMHRFDLDTATAFTVLRRASQHSNTKLRDVAAGLVTAQDRGGLDEELRSHGIGGERPERD